MPSGGSSGPCSRSTLPIPRPVSRCSAPKSSGRFAEGHDARLRLRPRAARPDQRRRSHRGGGAGRADYQFSTTTGTAAVLTTLRRSAASIGPGVLGRRLRRRTPAPASHYALTRRRAPNRPAEPEPDTATQFRTTSDPRVDPVGRRVRWHVIVPWVVYVVASWVFLYPILTTTIVADDFVNPFLQFLRPRSRSATSCTTRGRSAADTSTSSARSWATPGP